MRFIPAGHKIPLKNESTAQPRSTSPYNIFYDVYKPSTPFKKSAPPPPDFQLVVVKFVLFSSLFTTTLFKLPSLISARTTPMPTLQELTNLFDIMPEAPLPTPRQRRPPQGTTNTAPVTGRLFENSKPSSQPFVRRILYWFSSSEMSSTLIRRPNPFVALKSGKKHVLVAAVDSGNTSFFRFGQGEFTEWPMV